MADISRLVLEVDSRGVRNATDDLNRFGKTSKNTEKSVGGLSKGIGGMSKGFIAGGVAISALTVAIKGMAKFAKASISAFSEFEMVKTNLQVVTGSAEQAEKQFKDLKELASKTPFEVTGLANAGIMLQQSGVQAEELTNTLRMLGDVAGGNNEKFNRIAQNYAQILSVGKASAMDMRQFAMAGLPVMTMMKDMGIQGQATAEQVTEMFKRMTKEGGTFFNGMELQAGTLAGKTSTLKDTWKDFMATFAESTGLADIWKSVLDDLTKRIQAQTDAMEKNREGLKIAQDFYTGGVLGQGTYYQKVIEEQKAIFEEYGITLEQIEKSTDLAGDFGLLAQEVQVYKNAMKEMEGIQKEYDYQQRLLQIEKDRVEENKRLVALQQQQAQEFQSIFASIESEYNEKLESKLTDLQKVQRRINELDELLHSQKTVVDYEDRGYGEKVAHTKLVDAFNDEQKAIIQSLIDMLAEERNALRDAQKSTEENTDAITQNTDTQINTVNQILKDLVSNFLGSSDVGAFKSNLEYEDENGNGLSVKQVLLNTLANSLFKVLGGIQGIELILNPITEILKAFSPVLKSLLLFILPIAKGLQFLGQALYKLLNIITFGLFDAMAEAYDELLDVTLEEEEAIKNVTGDLSSLSDKLLELQDAIDKQEDYYRREKLNLSAQNRYSVNDMILTPQGTFSTHPKDTIIATKNPKDLVSGSVNITINNTQADNVDVRTIHDGMGNLIIDISRKVASDFASGSNGWDNAVGYRQMKELGRRLS